MIFAIPVFITVDLEYSRPRDVLLRTQRYSKIQRCFSPANGVTTTTRVKYAELKLLHYSFLLVCWSNFYWTGRVKLTPNGAIHEEVETF